MIIEYPVHNRGRSRPFSFALVNLPPAGRLPFRLLDRGAKTWWLTLYGGTYIGGERAPSKNVVSS